MARCGNCYEKLKRTVTEFVGGGTINYQCPKCGWRTNKEFKVKADG